MRHAYGIPAMTKSSFGKNQSSEVLTPDRGCVVLQKKIMEKTVMLVGTCTGICCFAQEQKEAEMFFNN